MRSGSYQHTSYTHQASPRRRVIALLLAVAANVLLLLLLLRLAPGFRPSPPPDLATFRLLPMAGSAATDTTRVARAKRSGGSRSSHPAAKPAKSTPPPVPTTMPLNMITLNHEDYAATDISKLPAHNDSPAQSADASGSGTSGAGDSAFAAGQGPNGERLYQVEWYRHPTNAELSTYLPHDAPGAGWGLIECQTIERFHVDNCRELADSPDGSGYARAVREAAWQFLVRPPRLGGKSLIGAWVGIRIDYGVITMK